jgi:hypothetical protein
MQCCTATFNPCDFRCPVSQDIQPDAPAGASVNPRIPGSQASGWGTVLLDIFPKMGEMMGAVSPNLAHALNKPPADFCWGSWVKVCLHFRQFLEGSAARLKPRRLTHENMGQTL